ncbi:Hybrid sensor histidine kinase/response regulator [Sulfidibacter corallicola]|uniref:histidine kinase n=1 Tax=Sulfidibacter corallicola TaxID=2818388 RepID=A0A8A4TU92_SULCO|nr:hybrid sensor histidine kinase/response regulator [Sulfidibacter corallicola]QTD53536.1 hybrid sensor histidine kinase/response regulator [Sulfidibacter corallicola]
MTQAVILVVDDHPHNLKVLFNLLTDSGYKVLVAQTGESALEQAIRTKPDLILLDIMMPGIGGFATCRRLKEHESTQSIPVIFLSALAESNHIVEGFNVGAVDYITKPFRQREVLVRIHTHLSLRNLQQSLEEKRQELERALEDKRQILNITVHDLKNPLQAIAGYLDLVRTQDGEIIDRIKQSTKVMFGIIDGLMRSAELENAGLALNTEPKYIAELVGVAGQEFAGQAKAKNQRMSFEIDKTCLAMVDPLRFYEAIANYLSNALKFSPSDTEIVITLRREGDRIHFSVRDQGPGLTEKDLQKVFGKFCRLSAKPTGSEPSTGLGLSIVKALVELHDGEVGVHNNPEGGCTFFLWIPAAASS